MGDTIQLVISMTLLAIVGLAAGFISGLLGVAGVVVVPALDLVFGALGMPSEIRLKSAIATSLAVVASTSWLAAKAHASAGAVDRKLVKNWLVPLILGVSAGTIAAAAAPAKQLSMLFGLTAASVALNMIIRPDARPLMVEFPNRYTRAFAGFIVGSISAMLGLGGAAI